MTLVILLSLGTAVLASFAFNVIVLSGTKGGENSQSGFYSRSFSVFDWSYIDSELKPEYRFAAKATMLVRGLCFLALLVVFFVKLFQ